MKNTLLILTLLSAQINMNAQDCVDSTLIDPGAACPLIWAPVCGCNGVTYANDCEAQNIGGVTSWTAGECAGGGCMDMTGLDFGLCDMFLGYTWLGNGCGPMSGCGYVIGNIDYSPNFYQTAWECQQACGSPLTDCINQWQIEQGYLVDCSPTLDPVCGCNGINYDNACQAYYYGGVTTYMLGSCDSAMCRVIPISTQFGECAMPLGWARLDTGCAMLSGCSYIGNNGYDYGALFFSNEADCLFGCSFESICIDSSLINPDIMCPAVIDPVCGCDGVTYNNSCEATNWYGVISYTPGPCISNKTEEIEDAPHFFPNPFSTFLQIELPPSIPEKLSVFNGMGQLMMETSPNQRKVMLETSRWPEGTYVVVASQQGKTMLKKTLVKVN